MSPSSCPVTWVATLLTVIGGVNWGLIGIGSFIEKNLNVVNLLLGSWPTVESIVYIVVGVSAVWTLIGMFKCCGKCEMSDKSM